MIIKIKAFIYRFSNIFGLHIFLAEKEQSDYIISLGKISAESREIHEGMWQAMNGFTSVWTWRMPFHKALFRKIKHAFDFRTFE
jgi:hypothetical protein